MFYIIFSYLIISFAETNNILSQIAIHSKRKINKNTIIIII